MMAARSYVEVEDVVLSGLFLGGHTVCLQMCNRNTSFVECGCQLSARRSEAFERSVVVRRGESNPSFGSPKDSLK